MRTVNLATTVQIAALAREVPLLQLLLATSVMMAATASVLAHTRLMPHAMTVAKVPCTRTANLATIVETAALGLTQVLLLLVVVVVLPVVSVRTVAIALTLTMAFATMVAPAPPTRTASLAMIAMTAVSANLRVAVFVTTLVMV
jgi:hypothetical protein